MKTTKRQEREVPNADHLPEISRESVYSFEHGGPLPTMAEILNADSPTQFALL